MKYILIGLLGGLGAIGRYGIDGWVSRISGGQFPWGTLAVNVLGSFFLGLLFIITTERFIAHPYWRIGLGIGLLGAFTTFSTFSLETIRLVEDGVYISAFMNILASVGAGLVAVYLGIVVGRTI